MVIPFVGEQEIQDIARNAYAGLRQEVPDHSVFVTAHSLRQVEVDFSSKFAGYQLFKVDLVNRVAYDGSIKLDETFRRKGIGRALVEGREAICAQLGIDLIIINKNENDSFWNHMGYLSLGIFNREVNRRAEEAGVFLSYAKFKPRFKIIKTEPEGI